MIKMIREWTEPDSMNGRKSFWQIGEKYYFISSIRELNPTRPTYGVSETMAFEANENEQVLSWHESWVGPYDANHAEVAQHLWDDGAVKRYFMEDWGN